MEKLLKPCQLAAILGISQKTLEQWRWRKIGPKFVKVGSLVRYRPTDVLDWLTANESNERAA